MRKNRKAARELATTPSHVPGADYAPARSPVNRMTTARMSAPHTTEERESSSSASEDDGNNREPLPSAVTSLPQQQQHIAAVEPPVASAPAPPNQATRKPAPIFRLPPKEIPEPVGPSLKVNMPEFTKRALSGAMQRHFVRAIAQQDTESARMYLEHEGTAHLDCLTPDALLAMRLIAMDIGFTFFSDPLHLIQELEDKIMALNEQHDDLQCAHTEESRRTDYTFRELREHASALKQLQQCGQSAWAHQY
jgi:hypothetical protein